MKLNSTQIRSAAVVALLAGFGPALTAQSSGPHGTNRLQDEQEARAEAAARYGDRGPGRVDSQRPGHNSNRTPGQHGQHQDPSRDSHIITTTTPAPNTMPDRNSRPGHNSDSLGAHGSAASGIVYTDDHAGRQDIDRSDLHAHQVSETDLSTRTAQLRKSSANELTGTRVQNRNGESLGRVKDFVIDTNSGQVVYAVVGAGGIAGIGEKLYPVPVQALDHSTTGTRETLTLDVESSRWAQAPRLERDGLESLQHDQQGKSIFDYYGQTWRSSTQSASMNNPVRTQGSQSGTTDTARDRQSMDRDHQGQRLALASDLIGKNIRSGNQTIGEVDDVIVHLDSNAAAALLDPDDDFAGSDQKYVVPLHRFNVSQHEALTSSLQRSDFSSAQNTAGASWASAGQQQSRNDTLFVYDADGRTEVRSDSARVTAPQQRQGAAPVAEIRRAIQSDSSLAANQSDIQVEAQGDKLVLRGTVLNEDTKEKIEDRAEKAAPGWDIDNQLSVAATGDMEE